MKYTFIMVFFAFIAFGCKEEEPPKTVYSLYQAGFTPTNGSATITDLGGGKLKIEINLNPFVKGQYPAHLHFGDIREVGELAYRLQDVDGTTGQSVTVLDRVELSNGEILTYDMLMEMNGSIKVHLNSELFKNTVLAYGNVGENDNFLSNGITVCTGH